MEYLQLNGASSQITVTAMGQIQKEECHHCKSKLSVLASGISILTWKATLKSCYPELYVQKANIRGINFKVGDPDSMSQVVTPSLVDAIVFLFSICNLGTLAIPITTVASEATFSAGSRVIGNLWLPKQLKSYFVEEIGVEVYMDLKKESTEREDANRAEIEAIGDAYDVFDTLMCLRDDIRDEYTKMMGLNDAIAQAKDKIATKEGHVKIMQAYSDVV
ncbi:hypothetical protein Tco_0585306, partial [Tanacetum coccineum]